MPRLEIELENRLDSVWVFGFSSSEHARFEGNGDELNDNEGEVELEIFCCCCSTIFMFSYF